MTQFKSKKKGNKTVRYPVRGVGNRWRVEDSSGKVIARYTTQQVAHNHATDLEQLTHVIVYDNGGKTADRYTIITPDGSVYGMSSDPFSPQGFSQYVGEKSEFPKGLSHTGKKVDATKLPDKVQQAILERMKEE